MGLVTRRRFCRGTAAAVEGLLLPVHAFGAGGRRLLRMGVLSDVHLGPKGSDELFLKELRYLDSQKVELVLFPGDLVDCGRISNMERFAACWEKVFPRGLAADGRKVDRVVVTGNHDYSLKGWDSYWKNFSQAEQEKDRFYYKDNHLKTWERLFGEKWELVWKREIRGITFIGAQYEWAVKPPIEEFFKAHGHEIDPSKPLIYVQHAHLVNTCHGEAAIEGGAVDSGAAGRALSRFPYAVAFSGHSHLPLTDDRAVWQGAFTSIGCGCAGKVATLGNGKRRVNAGDPWGACVTRLMPAIPNYFGNCAGMVVDLFADHLVIHRQSFAYDESIGVDWTVPLPARTDGPYDFARRLRAGKAPEFAADATLAFEYCEKAPQTAGTDFRGKKPCYRLTFPSARAVGGSRVCDYEVRASVKGREVYRCELFSAGYHLPERRASVNEELLIGMGDLPDGSAISFVVTPRDCYGSQGPALTADFKTPRRGP